MAVTGRSCRKASADSKASTRYPHASSSRVNPRRTAWSSSIRPIVSAAIEGTAEY
ncbi:hypothetical protein D3C83_266860 [compost metagenome]